MKMKLTVELPDETTALVMTFTYNGLWPSYNLQTVVFGSDDVYDGAEIKVTKDKKKAECADSAARR